MYELLTQWHPTADAGGWLGGGVAAAELATALVVKSARRSRAVWPEPAARSARPRPQRSGCAGSRHDRIHYEQAMIALGRPH